jgi:ATP-dependent helicase/nuclease subunit A
VHAVLQLIDLDTGDNLHGLAQTQAVAEGVGERVGEVRELVRVALDSDLVRQAVASGRYWREVYVGVPVGERVVEGFIDLLFETPEGLVIVDYKTDRIGDDTEATGVAEHYRWQGASYALAAQRALGRRVASCTFLVLGRTAALVAPLENLELAVAEVADLLSRPVRETQLADFGETPV